ncbi:hypothetical protein HMPREF9161_00256 [Selenomonas sp. F0473]|nr:hypothetical protein HMPREF9161_00256 [Selenomonas sp. F0473]
MCDMPMEANAAAVSTVMPPAPSHISEGRPTEGVQERSGGDSSAAFSQRTNVSIETAIDHMADVLSKINGRQQSSVEQMPQELKEVIQNIIKQSFSLETTLAQGLGSTAASQRFSIDQLTTLARMLNQLGTLSDAGAAPKISDDIAAILTSLKSDIAAETGGAFEPIMLTKAAFQLLDTGNPEFLPKELQTFLAQLGAQTQRPNMPAAGESASLRFLNQLVQLLMPRANSEGAAALPQRAGQQAGEPSVQAQQTAAQTTDIKTSSTQQSGQPATSTGTPAQIGAESTAPTAKGIPSPTADGQQEAVSQTNNPAGGNPVQAKVMPQQGNAPSALRRMPSEVTTGQSATLAKGTPEFQTQTTQGNEQGVRQPPQEQASAFRQQADPETNTGARQEFAANAQEYTAGQADTVRGQNPTTSVLRQGTAEFFSQTMENTPQMMQTIRSAAQALLYTSENLSQREVMLLQNFVNGRNRTLSEGDVKQLQQLIELTQQNVPGTVRQAAIEQRMPDLPRLWAFMQMADIVATRKMTAEQYKRAGRNVAALALSMRGALEGENAAPQPGQRSMNFIMPLFMGEAEYPAYIHVYDETHADEESGQVQKETWLRICVLTDHIGTVELINRIYEENHVDMRLYFSDPDAAWEFRSHLDEIRDSANDTPIVIEGIQIGAIGERRFFTN